MSDIHDEYIRYELAANILKQIFNDKKEGKGKEDWFR